MIFVAIGQFQTSDRKKLQAIFKAQAKLKPSGLSKAKYFLVGSNKVVTVLEAENASDLATALYRVPEILWEIHPAIDMKTASGAKFLGDGGNC